MEIVMPIVASIRERMSDRGAYAMVPLLGGAILGWLAWSPLGNPLVLLAIPFIWATQSTRLAAFLALLGYYLAGARDVPMTVSRFFPNTGVAFGAAIWGLHAAILALAWSLAWSPSKKGTKALFIRFALLSVVLVVPPFGSIAWLSPHLVAGLLYPGWGFLGIALTIIMLASIAATGYVARQANLALVAALALASAAANLVYKAPTAPAKWAAIDTRLGPFPTSAAGAFERHQTLIAAARDSIEAGNKVIILPEEVAGRWRPAASYWWRDLDTEAERRSAVVLVGADLGEGMRFRDALVLVGRQYGNVTSRQPIPLGLWRPWSNTGAIAGWIQPGVVQVAGETAALSFCYEDLLMWPLLVSMLHRPTVVVSVANDWFGDGLDMPYIQATSVTLMARAFDLPLVRALNR